MDRRNSSEPFCEDFVLTIARWGWLLLIGWVVVTPFKWLFAMIPY
jgi:hypothetical protein